MSQNRDGPPTINIMAVALVSGMPTEIRHIELSSITSVAFALGGVNGLIVSLPVIWNWINTGEWVTGLEMGIGMFAIGIAISMIITAITTVIVALVFAVTYNFVASRYGGIEVALTR